MMIPLNKLCNYDYKEFTPPLPDFSNLKAFKVSVQKKPVKIKLSKIHIDDTHGNSAREHGTNSKAIEAMKQSLSKGWITTECLPAVRKLKSKQGYEWELVYGYHRCQAIEDLYDEDFEMWFNVINCDETNIRKVRSFENEELPKAHNKESDIKRSIIQEIDAGILANDREEIIKWLNAVCPWRNAISKNRILSMVEEEKQTKSKFASYTESKANRWVKDHSAIPFAFGGEIINGKRTFLCKQGSQYRTCFQMIRRYVQDDVPCQVVFHVDPPTKGATLEKRRQQTLKAWNELLKSMKTLGANVSFMSVAGFLPQENGVENWSHLVQVTYNPNVDTSDLDEDLDEDYEELEEALGVAA